MAIKGERVARLRGCLKGELKEQDTPLDSHPKYAVRFTSNPANSLITRPHTA